jgi:hypothetical protein
MFSSARASQWLPQRPKPVMYHLPGKTSPDGRAASHGAGVFRSGVDRFKVEERKGGDGRAAARNLADAD